MTSRFNVTCTDRTFAYNIQASSWFVCLFVCLCATVVFVFYVFERERGNVRLALKLGHFIVLSPRLCRHATLLTSKCVTAYNEPGIRRFWGEISSPLAS